MQQALRWRWSAPGGLQTIVTGTTPSASRAECNAVLCMSSGTRLVGKPSRAAQTVVGCPSAAYDSTCSHGASGTVRRVAIAANLPPRKRGSTAIRATAVTDSSGVTSSPAQTTHRPRSPLPPAHPPPLPKEPTRHQTDNGQPLLHVSGPPPANASFAHTPPSGHQGMVPGTRASAPDPQFLRPPTPGPNLRKGAAAFAAAAVAAHTAEAAAAETAGPWLDARARHQAAVVPVRHVVAAVDPDLNGALAVIFWDEYLPDPPPPTDAAACACDAVDSVGGPGPYGAALTSPANGIVGRPGVWPGFALDAARVAAAAAATAAAAAADEGAGASWAAPDENEGNEGGEHELEGWPEGGAEAGACAPPAPPADMDRWHVRVWDMPTCASQRQKLTTLGRVSKRRLLNVAGARRILGHALNLALPSAPRPTALYGYVEVPPILPGDGSLSAYTSLWGTSTWLGLLAASGFAVGSTPVRRWKTDLGLYGARSKDADLKLARRLFPRQQPILRRKKDHGRADALLIAAWALGASLPPRLAPTLKRSRTTLDELLEQQPLLGAGLVWAAPRPPIMKDAYGNALTPEMDVMEELESANCKVARKDEERAARELAKVVRKSRGNRRKAGGGGGARRRKHLLTDADGDADGDAPELNDINDATAEDSPGLAASPTGRPPGSRRGRKAAAEVQAAAAAGDYDAGASDAAEAAPAEEMGLFRKKVSKAKGSSRQVVAVAVAAAVTAGEQDVAQWEGGDVPGSEPEEAVAAAAAEAVGKKKRGRPRKFATALAAAAPFETAEAETEAGEVEAVAAEVEDVGTRSQRTSRKEVGVLDAAMAAAEPEANVTKLPKKAKAQPAGVDTAEAETGEAVAEVAVAAVAAVKRKRGRPRKVSLMEVAEGLDQ